MMTKNEIRRILRAEREKIDPAYRMLCAGQVVPGLFDGRFLNLFSKFRNFASYLDTPEEFPTIQINQQVFAARRNLTVPRYQTEEKSYIFNFLPPGGLLQSGPHGILEPQVLQPFSPADLEVILVPGIAFNYWGERLGYGAGVYDRLLKKTRRSALKIGIAYDLQLLSDSLPQEAHDCLMDYVVTERQVVDCRKNREKGSGGAEMEFD